jgi:ubiquinone/menaquinone biosynthesis C-methylase UbiE
MRDNFNKKSSLSLLIVGGDIMCVNFKCADCGNSMMLPCCSCGHTPDFNNGVYQLTNDPYMVKDTTAEIQYIGYEDIGEAYSSGAAFHLMSVNDKLDKVAELIGDGVLLDLGCGDGLFTVPLLKRGTSIIAMDISDKMLSLLYKRAEKDSVDTAKLIVCRANALDIPLSNGSVDAVIANSMLHLISKPEKVVNEIYRVLKKGGKFISFEDKPTTSVTTDRNLNDDEKAENEKHENMVGYFHRRYFEILKNEHNLFGTRYSWKFDKESVCGELFTGKEVIAIPINNKIKYTFGDSFLCRMRDKGYSDQSDVPHDIHHNVFGRVLDEFVKKYGKNAVDTLYTGYENDIEITIYLK